MDIQAEFVKDLDLCKFEIANQDEYLIDAEKTFHTFLIVSITNWQHKPKQWWWPVCDAWSKFDIDHGPLSSDQSPTMDKSSAIETRADQSASISNVRGPKISDYTDF